VNLRLSRTAGILLAGLFLLQLIIDQIRLEVAGVYILLAIYFHIRHRHCLLPAARTGLGMKK